MEFNRLIIGAPGSNNPGRIRLLSSGELLKQSSLGKFQASRGGHIPFPTCGERPFVIDLLATLATDPSNRYAMVVRQGLAGGNSGHVQSAMRRWPLLVESFVDPRTSPDTLAGRMKNGRVQERRWRKY